MKTIWIQYLSLIAIAILASFQAVGQNFQEDYNKVLEHFASADNISMDAKIKVFTLAADSRPSYTQQISMKREGFKMFCEYDDLVIVSDGKNSLFLNKSEQSMVIQAMDKRKKNTPTIWDENAMKAMAKTDGEVTLIKSSGDIKTYKIDTPGEQIEQTMITFNMKKETIQSLTYIYNPKVYPNQQKIEISYSEFQAGIDHGKSTFSFDAFVTKEGKSYHPTQAYINYQVQTIGSLDFQ